MVLGGGGIGRGGIGRGGIGRGGIGGDDCTYNILERIKNCKNLRNRYLGFLLSDNGKGLRTPHLFLDERQIHNNLMLATHDDSVNLATAITDNKLHVVNPEIMRIRNMLIPKACMLVG